MDFFLFRHLVCLSIPQLASICVSISLLYTFFLHSQSVWSDWVILKSSWQYILLSKWPKYLEYLVVCHFLRKKLISLLFSPLLAILGYCNSNNWSHCSQYTLPTFPSFHTHSPNTHSSTYSAVWPDLAKFSHLGKL